MEIVGSTTDPYQLSAEQAINLGDTNKTVEEIYLKTSNGEGWPTTFLTAIGEH